MTAMWPERERERNERNWPVAVTFYFALTESAFISLSSLSDYSYGEHHSFEMSENASQVEKGTWRVLL